MRWCRAAAAACCAASAARPAAAGGGAPVSCVQTAEATGDRLAAQPAAELLPGAPAGGAAVVSVDVSQTLQTILGFGGAFTELSAINFAALNASVQEEVLRLYFASPEEGGNGYVLGRVPMGSCDFSIRPSYSFDDAANDTALAHFDDNVTHDAAGMIPLIARAQARAAAAGRNLSVFASPWSPPAWMKVPVDGVQSMIGSATPKGLLDSARPAWAAYFSRFISAYKRHGVALWGVTVQNEPGYDAGWEACVYSAADQMTFIRDHLGPTLRRDHPEVKILAHDDDRGDIAEAAATFYGDAVARDYTAGLAMHWYNCEFNEEECFTNVNRTRQLQPGKLLLNTEASNCGLINADDWVGAFKIARDIAGDLGNGANGWLNWNLLLDAQGRSPLDDGTAGCQSNLLADHHNSFGGGDGSVHRLAGYFAEAHFTRYFPPGAAVVGTSVSGSTELRVVAAVEPADAAGGRRAAVVVVNEARKEGRFVLSDGSRTTAELRIPARGIQTYQWQL